MQGNGQRDQQVLRTADGAALGVSSLPRGELGRLLKDPTRLIRENLGHPVKLDHGSLIVEVDFPMKDGAIHAGCKRYRPRNWWKAVRGWFRRSPARRDWQIGRTLLARGVTTARPLAVWEPAAGWLHRDSYLLIEWIEDAENLHLWAWRVVDLPIRERLRRADRCAESLGRLVGQMHAAGIRNRDLKGANVLVAEENGEARSWLIDMDGIRIRRRVSATRRAADLARLAVSGQVHPWLTPTIYLRFLRAYLAEVEPRAQWKPLWRDIALRSARYRRRRERDDRPIL